MQSTYESGAAETGRVEVDGPTLLAPTGDPVVAWVRRSFSDPFELHNHAVRMNRRLVAVVSLLVCGIVFIAVYAMIIFRQPMQVAVKDRVYGDPPIILTANQEPPAITVADV